MAASAPTMKTIHKRLYTVLPRGVSQAAAAAAAAASSSSSTSGRLRSNSASSSSPSSSRSFYSAPSPAPNVLAGFFDAGAPPPPPSPSPARAPLSSSRLPLDAARAHVESPPSPANAGQHHGHQSSHSSSSHGPAAPPSSLALTSPPANGSSPFGLSSAGPFFPYAPFTPPPVPSSPAAARDAALPHHPTASKRANRHKYHFDVGAYGIPKRSSSVVSGRDGKGGYGARWSAPSLATDALDLAVQVGEDAYFVRENAMGVADGVGGWSRSLAPTLGPSDPSPSALFARRLMHFCSAEIASLSAPSSSSSASSETSQTAAATTFAFYDPPAPHVPFFPGPGFASWREPYAPSPLPSSPLYQHQYHRHPFHQQHQHQHHHPLYHHEQQQSQQQATPLDAVVEEDDPEMDELEEGLDVLLILERAYARTLEAHVAPAPPPPPAMSTAVPSRPASPAFFRASPPHEQHRHHRDEKQVETVPLMTGSSTALLAVLDSAGAGPHPHPVPEVASPTATTAATTETASSSTTTGTEAKVAGMVAEAGAGAAAGECDAVLRIAHLGDCMGMLVRGEDIVWRSDEMWWSFNTPLQLGPASRTPPASAQLLTLPVRADDILILASDGLSDNLWDEDVLDEVVRFRRAARAAAVGADATSTTTTAGTTSAAATALGRKTLAGMLSEALCSRARAVSERRGSTPATPTSEIPFARRAREEGRAFSGGKSDDISVLVAIISPAEEPMRA